jgi:hypothetical protein
MRCEELREALLQARYGATAEHAEQAAHLASCGACQQFARAQAKLDNVLARSENMSAGPGFDTRFFARLEAEKSSGVHARKAARSRRSWLWWSLVPTLTAAAATALILWRRPDPHAVPQEDLALATDLELVQELPVVEHLDEAETFEVLAEVDVAELAKLTQDQPVQDPSAKEAKP